jgi:hypothetical protein
MLHLQKSFPTESECQGLRIELNASKSGQQSLEEQQAARSLGLDTNSIVLAL